MQLENTHVERKRKCMFGNTHKRMLVKEGVWSWSIMIFLSSPVIVLASSLDGGKKREAAEVICKPYVCHFPKKLWLVAI